MIQSARSPEGFAETYAKVAAANRHTLARLETLLRAFQERGVECILLKGCDLVTRVYPTLGQRQVGDVDLLVHERDLEKVDAVAISAGLKRQINGNAAYEDENFLLDVINSIWYLEDDAPIWKRAALRKAMGLEVRGMEATDALFFLCAWTCLHRAYFTANFPEDVAMLVKAEPIDWARLTAEAGRLGLRMPLRHSLEHARAKRPISVPEEAWSALAPASSWERAQLAIIRKLVIDRRLFGLSHALMYLTKPRGARFRALGSALSPDERFMRFRYGERGAVELFALRLWRPFYLAGQAALLLGRIAGRLLSPAAR